jgi:hypothetical protein
MGAYRADIGTSMRPVQFSSSERAMSWRCLLRNISKKTPSLFVTQTELTRTIAIISPQISSLENTIG